MADTREQANGGNGTSLKLSLPTWLIRIFEAISFSKGGLWAVVAIGLTGFFLVIFDRTDKARLQEDQASRAVILQEVRGLHTKIDQATTTMSTAAARRERYEEANRLLLLEICLQYAEGRAGQTRCTDAFYGLRRQ